MPGRRKNDRYATGREVILVNPEVVLPRGYQWLKVQTVLKRPPGWKRGKVPRITSVGKAVDFTVELLEAMDKLDRENVYVVMLDPDNQPVGIQRASIGGTRTAYAVPMDIFRAAVVAGADGIIVVHNHPSGRLEESGEDRTLAHALKEAAKILGMRFVDFIIIGHDGAYLSFKSQGLV